MRINTVNNVSQIYQANSAARYNQMNKTTSKDSLEISSVAKDLQAALNAVKQSEDVRLDRVNELKKQMDSGTYQVSNKEVADKLVERFFSNMYR